MKKAATIGIVVAIAAACTAAPAGDPTPSAGSSAVGVSPTLDCPTFVLDRNDGRCLDTLELEGVTYRVMCVAVPPFMLDVAVPARWGGSAVRAIVAVPTAHAVAVTADDERCGTFALAVASGVGLETRDLIVDEIRAAAELPPDLEK